MFNNICRENWSVALSGLGCKHVCYNPNENIEQDLESVRIAAGIGIQKLTANGCDDICVDSFGMAEQAAEGAALASWRYQANKNKDQREIVPDIHLYNVEQTQSNIDSWQRGLFKAASQNYVRTISATPSNFMTPIHFAYSAVEELCSCGIEVEVSNILYL